jgi:hypothetical protein
MLTTIAVLVDMASVSVVGDNQHSNGRQHNIPE